VIDSKKAGIILQT